MKNLFETFTPTTRNRKITATLILATLCLLVLSGSGWTHGKSRIAQQKEKTVSKHPAPRNEPLEITDIRTQTKAVKLGESFEDEPGWLKHLTFKVKNKSDKAITFLQIDLDFPETEKTAGAIMMHQIFLGQRPDVRLMSKNPPLYIKPNETIEISLEPIYGDIKTLIELKHPSVEVVNKLSIRTGDIMFEDATLYSGGLLHRRNPDPNSPRKWIEIDADQPAPQSN